MSEGVEGPPVVRLHLLAVPHTITHERFSHCAFTGKVRRFSKMMRARPGFEVYHYGVEGSVSGADVDITVLSIDEWTLLRRKAYKSVVDADATDADADAALADTKAFIGTLAKTSTDLYRTFNDRVRAALRIHYRGRGTDIVCLPFGEAHRDAIDGLNVTAVESGIGYRHCFLDFRIYESYAWLHAHAGLDSAVARPSNKPSPLVTIPNYWFVCPNYYDCEDWPMGAGSPEDAPPTVGMLGRIGVDKGCGIVVDVARRMPDVVFVLCGQGDPAPYVRVTGHSADGKPTFQTRENAVAAVRAWCADVGDAADDAKYKVRHAPDVIPPNVCYEEPLHGADVGEFLGSLDCLLSPTVFLEPFCGVVAEAQLCGTPVVTPSVGAQTETVEDGRTGTRCHTLADFCEGVRRAVSERLEPRTYIRRRAQSLWSLEAVGVKYERALRSILDVTNGAGGWYGDVSWMPPE